LIAHAPPLPSRALEKTVPIPGNFAGPLLVVFGKSGMEREVDILFLVPVRRLAQLLLKQLRRRHHDPWFLWFGIQNPGFFLPAIAYVPQSSIADNSRLSNFSSADPELALLAQLKARINPVTVDISLIRCVRPGRKQDLNSQAGNFETPSGVWRPAIAYSLGSPALIGMCRT
jgi:hypothetical protein